MATPPLPTGSQTSRKQVISASRRTDIPAFYMEWFMDSLQNGRFLVENPYSRQTFSVPVSPENTDTFVFWSKNFQVFIDGGYGETLLRMGYHLFFNFTVNSEDRLLEPHVPALEKRLAQIQELADRFGPKTVTWRFDPVCHYVLNGIAHNNLHDFERIASVAALCKIERCVTSFADLYGKVLGRQKHIPGFAFTDPPVESKIEILLEMNDALKQRGITLSLCCEKDLFRHIPLGSGIEPSSCIPNPLLEKLSGVRLSSSRDSGQRRQKGCGCYVSKDIGSYRLHPCFHTCLFCYANPEDPEKVIL